MTRLTMKGVFQKTRICSAIPRVALFQIMNNSNRYSTLQGTNISHLGKKETHLQHSGWMSGLCLFRMKGTPQKTNMEPENQVPWEKENIYKPTIFGFQVFRGVILERFWSFIRPSQSFRRTSVNQSFFTLRP